MALSLNFTAPLKQDPESQKRLRQLAAVFADQVQPEIDAALAKSELVHFARILIIDNKYIQVLTEFDGDPMAYTEFFRTALPTVFERIFSLVEGAPPWQEINNPNGFYEYTHSLNLKALGESSDTGYDHGYLFSAFGDATVREIKDKIAPTT
ncbi:MAG TPA: hypothetical protein VFA63_03840 [Pseudonocardiaceae bacterium]|jgi:hypothetical protein|nr:hypothetical protein [Pseudonocardiaceae bacterium]